MLVCEVAPRDGLQNERTVLTSADRAELCKRLAGAGLRRIEAVSFVSARRVPAMAGAEAVIAALDPNQETVWSGLVLNERGYERASRCGLGHINCVVAVTDAFCRRNQGLSLDGAVGMAARLVGQARADRKRVTVTLAVAFGCPFEGTVSPGSVTRIAERIAAKEPDEIILADTIGVGVPAQVRRLVDSVASIGAPVGCHLHDTRHSALANAVAAIESGATILDASVGGTGGCPFAPGSTGNVATEEIVCLLERMGFETGVSLGSLLDCSHWLARKVGREAPARLQ